MSDEDTRRPAMSDEERAARRERKARRRERMLAATEPMADTKPGVATQSLAQSGARKPGKPTPVATPKAKVAGYEFSSAENERFEALAEVMRFVGVAALVMALVGGIFAYPLEGSRVWRYVLWVVQIVLPLAAGIWIARAGNAFRAIATTHGSDMSHLMDAIRQLTRLFVLLAAVIVAGVALFVFAMVLVSLRQM